MMVQMERNVIIHTAQYILKALANYSGYIHYLPNLRIRFSATSEEVMGGVRLADRIVGIQHSGGDFSNDG